MNMPSHPNSLRDQFVWDMTMSWTKLLRDESTLPRLHALGVNVIGLTVASDRHYGPDVALQNIREVGELIARDPRYCLVRIPADAKFARANNQLGIELNFQGVGPLGGNLARIGEFAELGVRHIGLAWNSPNDAGGSAAVAQDDGLTAFGRAAMAEMERVGILVDGAHAGYRTMMEAISCASKPFIVSHTNCAAVTEAHRNVRDDQIKACAQTGGVIGMTGFGNDIGDRDAKPEALFRHIDHIAQLVGVRHVGLGLDFLEKPDVFWDMVLASPQTWPGKDGRPMERCRFMPHEDLESLVSLMHAAGYGEEGIAAVMGENWLRVFPDKPTGSL